MPRSYMLAARPLHNDSQECKRVNWIRDITEIAEERLNLSCSHRTDAAAWVAHKRVIEEATQTIDLLTDRYARCLLIDDHRKEALEDPRGELWVLGVVFDHRQQHLWERKARHKAIRPSGKVPLPIKRTQPSENGAAVRKLWFQGGDSWRGWQRLELDTRDRWDFVREFPH